MINPVKEVPRSNLWRWRNMEYLLAGNSENIAVRSETFHQFIGDNWDV